MANSSTEHESRTVGRERQWFRDLEQGTGEAANLDEEVRRVLQLSTVDIAVGLSLRARTERENARQQQEQERQRVAAERAAAARRQRETSPAVMRARYFSNMVLIWYIALLVTALVPWIIGTNWLRDTLFRQRSSLVYSSSNRDGWEYFATDYHAGAAVLTLIVGVAVGLASLVYLRRSIGRMVTAIALVLSVFLFWIPMSTNAWDAAELSTVKSEASSVPDGPAGCTKSTNRWPKPSVVLTSGGINHTWTVHVTDSADDVCDQVTIWDGVRFVRVIETPNIIDGVVAVFGGGDPESVHVVFLGAGPVPECEESWCQPEYEVIGGFTLNDTEVAWQRTVRLTSTHDRFDEEYPMAGRSENYFAVVENPGSAQSRLVVLDPATGEEKWVHRCPPALPFITQFYEVNDGFEFLFQCMAEDSNHYERFKVTSEGDVVPE